MSAHAKPSIIHSTYGFVVWDTDRQVVCAKDDGAFVYDTYNAAQVQCKKFAHQRPRRVQIVVFD